jgi:hypothetical protein
LGDELANLVDKKPIAAKATLLGDILTLSLNLARFVREATRADPKRPRVP